MERDRALPPDVENRAAGPVEVRASGDEPPVITGYAAVFNTETEIAGLFRERLAPEAFDGVIGRDDVRALFNHDPNYVLGRTTNQTLALRVDTVGLRYTVTPPDTAWARDLLASLRRGDVSQSSFAFRVLDQQWTKPDTPDGLPLRTITAVELYDVSPVTYPAYTSTTAQARAAAAAARDELAAPVLVPADDEALARQWRRAHEE